jgi:type VI secretion system protein ImpI
MPLRLQIVSAHRESMGASYIQEFSACGGTIGRSLECDWPLPDSKRYISSRHAMIDYQAGAYYLVDLSRNGIYVNGSNSPVGQGNPQRLFDGDVMRFGEFEIKIALIEDATEGANDGMTDSIVRAQMVQEDESMEISMLPDDHLHDANILEVALRPGDAPGELSALRELPPGMSNHLAEGAAEQALTDAASEFLTTAGLNPDDFRGLEPQLLLKNAALLLAEFAEGTHALLAAKDKIMAGLNIKSQNAASNPLRSSDGIDNALRLLLSSSNKVHSTGTDAVEEAFDDLLQHQHAVISAMRNALGDYLGHFEPGALERHFENQKKLTGASDKEFRDLYAQAFQGLAQPNNHKLPQRFDDEFARAYELETTD